ncbi:MAG: enoyl-CoA hydratase [Candidatus Hydrogenedentes bacterium]|nr:enoyl-CoA hydratase [Candidatus Hydrogenedentota bacterium]
MAYTELLYSVSDHVATITLNRPDKLNAWTLTMEKEYRHAMATAEADEQVRVIIVTGAGKGFCAGADMSLLASVQQGTLDVQDTGTDDVQPGAGPDTPDAFQKPYSFPLAINKPIIAAINGAAVGIGLVHAMYCDIRFASDTAKFGTAFAQRGLIAEHGLSWLLPRLIGVENALDLMLSSRIIFADEARQMGLVSRVVKPETLMDTVHEYARHLASKCSPRSLSIIKRQVWHDQLSDDLAASCDTAIREMFDIFATADFAEGVMSYLEKRPPNFTGK